MNRPLTLVLLFGLTAGLAVLLLWWPAPPPEPTPRPATPPEPPPPPLTCLLVHVTLDGADPFEAERLLLHPLTQALTTVGGVGEVQAEAREGGVTLAVGLEGRNDRRREVADALGTAPLPEDAGRPILRSPPGPGPALVYTLTGDLPPNDLARLHERLVRSPLERVPGVVEVRPCGVGQPQVEVLLDDRRLDAYGLTAGDALRALQVPHLLSPRQAPDLEALLDAPVTAASGQIVRLRDVATLAQRMGAPRCTLQLNGRAAVGGEVWLSRAQAVAAVRRVLAEVPSLSVDVFEIRPDTPVLAVTPPDAGVTPSGAAPHTVVVGGRDDARVYLPGATPQQAAQALAALRQTPGVTAWPVGAPQVVARLRGPDLEVLRTEAERVRAAAAAIPGVVLAYTPADRGPPGLDLRLQRNAMASLGLHPAGVAESLRLATHGVPVGLMGPDFVPLVARLAQPPSDPSALRLRTADGRSVSLAEVAETVQTHPPAVIRVVDGRREVPVVVILPADQAETVRAQVRAGLRRVPLPDGVALRLDALRCGL